MKRAAVLLAVLLVAASGAAVARGLQFRGAAKPGVHVLGIDVGGDSREQIAHELRGWSRQLVTIRTGGHSYRVPRGWLVSMNVAATTSRALAAGSEIALVVPSRVDVMPVVGRATHAGNVLDALARAGRVPVSATIAVQGTTVVVTPARDGQQLDTMSLLRRLSRGLSVVDAPFSRLRPAISDATAQAAATEARELLAQPVQIDYHGARRGALSSVQIARALSIQAHGNRLSVKLDGDALAKVVRPRLGTWIQRAHNAQFVVAGANVSVAPSRPGRDVEPAQLARAITAAAKSGHVARVELGARQPDLTTAKANALGIREKLTSFT
ncbi:MAG TPA: peptidoglycan binding domain-containing protein, partial [Gaiellaceae bacterium]|nr:peptidoglycan binding domain-containing protein [Gaiellaceae bacterium]